MNFVNIQNAKLIVINYKISIKIAIELDVGSKNTVDPFYSTTLYLEHLFSRTFIFSNRKSLDWTSILSLLSWTFDISNKLSKPLRVWNRETTVIVKLIPRQMLKSITHKTTILPWIFLPSINWRIKTKSMIVLLVIYH